MFLRVRMTSSHSAARLLSAIARSVNLPPNFFDDKVNLGNSILRVIHYPPMPADPTASAAPMVVPVADSDIVPSP